MPMPMTCAVVCARRCQGVLDRLHDLPRRLRRSLQRLRGQVRAPRHDLLVCPINHRRPDIRPAQIYADNKGLFILLHAHSSYLAPRPTPIKP